MAIWWDTLYYAAMYGKIKDIRTLIDAGEDTDTPDESGLTPLHYAAGWSKDPQAVKILLDAGVDVNILDESSNTPLHYAAGNVNLEAIKTLLEGGADVNTRNRYGSTPLNYMASLHKTPKADAIITTLLDAGADPKARNDSGITVWDLIRNNQRLKDTAGYRRLQEAVG